MRDQGRERGIGEGGKERERMSIISYLYYVRKIR